MDVVFDPLSGDLVFAKPGPPGADGAPGPAGPQGPQGPQGPGGSGGGGGASAALVFYQATPVTTWEFTYDINTFSTRPDVDTYDNSGDRMEGDVSFPMQGKVRVTFGFPMSGSVVLR